MSSFLLWVFDHYCDSDSGHYGHANRGAEYGISKADFVNESGKEAQEDAKTYLGHLSVPDRRDLVARWHTACNQKAAFYTQLGKTVIEVDTL